MALRSPSFSIDSRASRKDIVDSLVKQLDFDPCVISIPGFWRLKGKEHYVVVDNYDRCGTIVCRGPRTTIGILINQQNQFLANGLLLDSLPHLSKMIEEAYSREGKVKIDLYWSSGTSEEALSEVMSLIDDSRYSIMKSRVGHLLEKETLSR